MTSSEREPFRHVQHETTQKFLLDKVAESNRGVIKVRTIRGSPRSGREMFEGIFS